MISRYKLQARSLLMQNIGKYFLPVFLFLFTQLVSYIFLNFIVNYNLLVFGATVKDYLLIVLYFIFATLGTTVAIGLIWKQSIKVACDIFKENIYDFKIGKSILINIIPSAIGCVYGIFDALNTYIYSILYSALIMTVVLLVILIIRCYLFYKFLFANYLFLTEHITPINAIKKSFSLTRKKLFYFFKLEFSFILWDIAIVLIHILMFFVLKSFAVNTLYLGLFSTFGYGIKFYLIPYRYLTYTLAIAKTVDGSVS